MGLKHASKLLETMRRGLVESDDPETIANRVASMIAAKVRRPLMPPTVARTATGATVTGENWSADVSVKEMPVSPRISPSLGSEYPKAQGFSVMVALKTPKGKDTVGGDVMGDGSNADLDQLAAEVVRRIIDAR